MKNFNLFLFFAVVFAFCVRGAELLPSGELPVCYISTKDSQPIDQKETYIEATFYMTSPDGQQDVASQAEPLTLGIRGRGNASWTQKAKKPYKLKFDKKTAILGMPKNKHFALLTIPWDQNSRYGNYFAFLLSRELGLAWTPDIHPVEVVLNGDYIGLYHLAETVRIDENRLDIIEQGEDNNDEETIGEGWLVEMDNYADENQIVLPSDDPDFPTSNLFTVHTPEPMNTLHKSWITKELSKITAAVESTNIYSRQWEEYIDVESLAKYFIIQEVVHNYDGFVGSTYFYKDTKDSKWEFGPIWDAGDNFNMGKDDWVITNKRSPRRKIWMKNIMRFPRFWVKAREVWENSGISDRLSYYKAYFTELNARFEAPLYVDAKRWPELYFEGFTPVGEYISAYNKAQQHINWINTHIKTDYVTHKVTVDFDETKGSVALEGLAEKEYDVFRNNSIEMTITPNQGVDIDYVTVDGVDITEDVAENNSTIKLQNIQSDTKVCVAFSDISLAMDGVAADCSVKVNGRVIEVSSKEPVSIINPLGILIWQGNNSTLTLPSGIYIVRSKNTVKKISL